MNDYLVSHTVDHNNKVVRNFRLQIHKQFFKTMHQHIKNSNSHWIKHTTKMEKKHKI